MEKVTYTPAEFAEAFGKERTWAYRQLYAGKVQAITELGRTLIPKSEVDRLLKEAGRYLGAKAKPKKEKLGSAPAAKPQANDAWLQAIKRRKTRGPQQQESARSEDGRKPSSPGHHHPYVPAISRQSVYQRLTQYKSSRKSGEDHGA